MGISGISIWQLLIILIIILVIFVTKKLRSIGADLGEAVKSFRNALREEESPTSSTEKTAPIEHKQEQANKAENSAYKNQSDTGFEVNSDNEQIK